jgi:hypothetical protein
MYNKRDCTICKQIWSCTRFWRRQLFWLVYRLRTNIMQWLLWLIWQSIEVVMTNGCRHDSAIIESGHLETARCKRCSASLTELSLDKLLDKIREMIKMLPPAMAAVVRHAVLTGLRPAEAVESVRLLLMLPKIFREHYYNPELQCLEHFRFPQFQRTMKKCYISYITKEQLSPIVNKNIHHQRLKNYFVSNFSSLRAEEELNAVRHYRNVKIYAPCS